MNSLVITAGCLFLFAGMACVNSADYKEVFKVQAEACAAELNIPISEAEANMENFELEGEQRTKLGCFKACILKSMNALKDGQLNVEGLRTGVEQMVEPQKVAEQMEIVNKCMNEVQGITDECNIAFEFFRCYKSNSAE